MFRVVIKPVDDMKHLRLSFDHGSLISSHRCIKQREHTVMYLPSHLPTPHKKQTKTLKAPYKQLNSLQHNQNNYFQNGSHLHR